MTAVLASNHDCLLLTLCLLGYVQCMSDLLAPMLVVMEDEVDASWCLAGLKDMLVSNECTVFIERGCSKL